jgi:hypothetical protein
VFALFRKPDTRRFVLHPDVPDVLKMLVETHTAAPAFIANARFDLIAWNRYTRVLFGYEEGSDPMQLNIVWRMFHDPTRRALFDDWEFSARLALARFRLSYARYQGHPDFESLMHVMLQNPDFARLWQKHEVLGLTDSRQLTISHDTLGRMQMLPAYAMLDSIGCYLALFQCTTLDVEMTPSAAITGSIPSGS